MLEAAQTFLGGYGLARALDDGFLRDRAAVGLGWLAVAAVAILAGAWGTSGVYRAVAGLVEPLRDILVRRAVTGALARATGPGPDKQNASGAAAVSRLAHQVEIARDSTAGILLVSRQFVVASVGALLGLLALAPPLLLVVVPPVLAGVGLLLVSLRPMARRQRAYLRADERLAAEAGVAAAGLRDVVACGGEDVVRGRLDGAVDAELRASLALARWAALRSAALGVAGHVPVVVLLAAAPWLLRHGVTAGAVVGALTYLTQSLMPALQALIHGLGNAGARLVVVLGWLLADAHADAPLPEEKHSAPAPAHPGAAALELRGVTFAYGPGARPVVDGLDLTVPEGGHLAVVGPSGIGKSTLAGLTAGVLAPDRGRVRVRGVSTTADAERARAARVLVPQEAYVFAGTLAANLGYLRPDGVPEGELRYAVELLGLGPLAERLGGAAGRLAPAALSAGERQLVALARAWLAPAPLLLLDEATCHLDPAAEARAERALAARPGGTLVVVAHRIDSARRADRVLVMDGTRTALGTHDDLLVRSPLYRDLAGLWDLPPSAAFAIQKAPRPYEERDLDDR
ncbi:ATP-binding cassette domain-containing protein [Streptomyces sp. NPDC048172]|uniref:ATP-binding cassette domain-containing protein n=1 Tax=Streptomyces sp. NPDC048172 TaxID=3365505 RepID=UPI00371DDE20